MQVFWMVMVVTFSMLLGVRIAYPRGMKAGYMMAIAHTMMVIGDVVGRVESKEKVK